MVVACGNCINILANKTALNDTKLVDGVYWYFTPNQSFGFSPSPIIQQDSADIYDDNIDNQRVSWHLDQGVGGYRLGILNPFSNNYYKVILII